ncbi:MAG: HNH endonuclease [Phycisphaerae bacterium]|nr:HNH endonuclease [Phycisphaerae bacterium]
MTKQFVPFVCLNCGEKLLLHTSPKLYCSVGCSQEAELVRYVRRCIKDGRIKRPDVLEAIQIRLAHVVAGGYQKQERHIPPDVRQTVIVREKGRCRICGQPGTEIDHIEGSSIRLENLQLLCDTCHNKKTRTNIVEVRAGDEGYATIKAKHDQFWERAEARHPMRICDDEENWTGLWHMLLAECRQALNKKTGSRGS